MRASDLGPGMSLNSFAEINSVSCIISAAGELKREFGSPHNS
jgi:hypothetical protein